MTSTPVKSCLYLSVARVWSLRHRGLLFIILLSTAMNKTIPIFRRSIFGFCMFVSSLFLSYTSAASAQGCYTKTGDFGYGSNFIHATSDSTCYVQYRDSVWLSNVRTGETYLRFSALPPINKMELFDSILVLMWGESFELFRMTDSGTAQPLRSVIDSSQVSLIPDLRIAKRDSFLIVWKPPVLHQYKIVRNTVSFIDSMVLHEDDFWSTIGLTGDTIVISPFTKYVKRFQLSDTGIRFLDSIRTNMGFVAWPEKMFFHQGDMYCYSGGSLLRYVRENGIFVQKIWMLDLGDVPFVGFLGDGVIRTEHGIVLVGGSGDIAMLDWDLDTVCTMRHIGWQFLTSCSNHGSKIFMVSPQLGIATYIPAVTSLAETPEQWRRSHDLVVYPNPTTNENAVTVKGARQIDRCALFDMTGRAVDPSQYSYRICGENVELRYRVPPGVYFLRVSHDAQLTTERVVIIPR